MNGAPRGDGRIHPDGPARPLTYTEPVALRIGDDERNAAAAALGEHLSAGRIDLNEYGQRSARVFAAHTQVDLQELFCDLPAPHQVATVSATTSPKQNRKLRSAGARRQTPVLPSDEAERSIAERLAAVVLGITGMITFVAVVALLHFWSEAWIVFLVVPALAAAAEATWGDGWRTRYL